MDIWTDKERNEWVNEYFGLVFSENATNKLKIKGESLKNMKLMEIGSLYRYRNQADIERLIASLEKNETPQIWFSNPCDFNDPFDTWSPNVCTRIPKIMDDLINYYYNKICVSSNLNDSEKTECYNLCKSCIPCSNLSDFISSVTDIFVRYCPNLDRKTVLREIETETRQPIINTYINQQKKSGVACFSEVPNSILMWSHYGDSHKGVCLEYTFQTLNNVVINNTRNDSLTKFIYPINYKTDLSEYVRLTSELILNFMNNMNPKPDSCRVEIMRHTLTKAIEWSYEREWRILVAYNSPRQHSIERYIRLLPDCIYLGAKISNHYEDRIRYLCEKRGIRVKKMQMADYSYQLIETL